MTHVVDRGTRVGFAVASFVSMLLFVSSPGRAQADEPPTPAPVVESSPAPKAPPPPKPGSTKPAKPGSDIVTGAGKPRVDETGDPIVKVEALERPPQPRRPASTSASFASQLEWRWPKFSFGQYALTAGQGLLAVGSQAIPGGPRWTAPNDFDDSFRELVRLRDYESYLYARDASDVGLVLLINQQLVDTLFATWWFHDKGSTAWQMAMIDLQTLSFSASLNQLVSGIVGRERPYARVVCDGGRESDTSDCKGNNRYRSFFSGHATAAFTLATLTCVHHANVPIYGGGPGEAIPCIAGMAVASGVGLLRIMSDQHYLSDVLAGTAFGIASGVAIPYLFHYGQEPVKEAMKSVGLPEDVWVMPTPTGVTAGGTF